MLRVKELNINVIRVVISISLRSINILNRYKYIASTRPYRDITSVMFRRLINKDILLLFLTIIIRYKTEMHVNRHIVDAIYMYQHVAVLP